MLQFAEHEKLDFVQKEDSLFKLASDSDSYQRRKFIRFAIVNNEFSERVLEVCKNEFQLYPSDLIMCDVYIKCLTNLMKINADFDIKAEYHFIHELLLKYKKPYQLWYSFDFILRNSKEDLFNIEDIRKVLDCDDRNFHLYDFLLSYSNDYNICKECIDLAKSAIECDYLNGSAISFYININKKFNLNLKEAYNFLIQYMKEEINNEAITTAIYHLCELDRSLIDETLRLIEEFEEDEKKELYFIYDLHILLLRLLGDESKTKEICEKLSLMAPHKKKYWEKFEQGIY